MRRTPLTEKYLKAPSALLAAIASLVTSLVSAVAYVAWNDWFGAADMRAFIFWSLPFAALIYVGFRRLPARWARASSFWRYPLLTLIGGITGIAWTMIVALLLGGLFGAFSFPVLLCWVAAGAFAGIGAAWHSAPTTWPAALVSALLIGVLLITANEYMSKPEPAVRVVLGPETTRADEDRFWREVIGNPDRTPTEHSFIDGVSSVGIVDYEAGRPVFEVRLRKGLSRQRRDRILSRIRRASIVARIDSFP